MQEETFRLPRPDWVEDYELSCCTSCHKAFSLLLRRHHCRQCGYLFCYHCCFEKMRLPQFGYNEHVLVCKSCMNVAHLIAGSLSDDIEVKRQTAPNFADYTAKGDDIERFINYGGLEATLLLLRIADRDIQYSASGAIYNVARDESLQSLLVRKDVVPVIIEIASSNIVKSVMLHIVSTLYLLCSNESINEDLAHFPGLLHCFNRYLSQKEGELALVAARAVTVLANNEKCQLLIVNGSHGTLRSLFELLKDGQNVEINYFASKTLMRISASPNQMVRAKLIQMDCFLGGVLANCLLACENQESLRDLIIVLVNIGAVEDNSFTILLDHTFVNVLCEISKKYENEMEIQIPISRAIYNLSKLAHNRSRCSQCIGGFMDLLNFSNEEIQFNILSSLFYLIEQGVLNLITPTQKNSVKNTLKENLKRVYNKDIKQIIHRILKQFDN